jgi:hypothetical protein
MPRRWSGPTSPRGAQGRRSSIKAKCLECCLCGGKLIKECGIRTCPLLGTLYLKTAVQPRMDTDQHGFRSSYNLRQTHLIGECL